jgi:hypothetical protein
MRGTFAWCAFICIATCAGLARIAQAAETYVRATVGSDGRLHIVTQDGREISPKLQADQVGFEDVKISPAGRAVGWLALYTNCCTSYPIPLRLVIYRNGELRSFTGHELPVWRWCFEAGGTRVAFEQETVHGGMGVHYELRDIVTGRLLAQFDPKPNQNGNAEVPPKDLPKWAAEVDSQR